MVFKEGFCRWKILNMSMTQKFKSLKTHHKWFQQFIIYQMHLRHNSICKTIFSVAFWIHLLQYLFALREKVSEDK